MSRKRGGQGGGEGGNVAQKRGPPPSPPDAVGANKKIDKSWNAFAQQKDGSIQWIPEQIVGIGEDFHNNVNDVKVKTTLYKVRWNGS